MPQPARLALALVALAAVCCTAAAQQTPVHGVWVWKGSSIVDAADGPRKLRDFCVTQSINEVYLSLPPHDQPIGKSFAETIDLLHQRHIRVEALLSSTDADQPGPHREKLLDQVRELVRFNQNHPKRPFDGLHLDIEPQQRPENKGPGNLRFLPGLVDAYRAVKNLADSAHLPVNADIQTKLLKGSLDQRKLLLSSLPRFTLMLYELSSPNDGQSVEQKTERLRAESKKYLDRAYDGLPDSGLATLVIGLRTPDYGEQLLPKMLDSLDTDNQNNPHYAGWARHSYNDTLAPQK